MYTRDGSHRHNHAASEDIRVHAAHRRRAADQVHPGLISNLSEFVSAQTAAGVSVSSIHASILHGNSHALTIPKDIANAISAARLHGLATQTSTQALFAQLNSHGFFFEFTVTPEATSRLRNLFWAHPESTNLYKLHPDVLIFDCTYKTNKYEMPLLNIIA